MSAGPAGVRYLLCPGEVQSATDGQWHWVSAPELARLYGVPYAECSVLPDREHGALGGGRTRTAMLEAADRGKFVCLWPRRDGKYVAPPLTPGGGKAVSKMRLANALRRGFSANPRKRRRQHRRAARELARQGGGSIFRAVEHWHRQQARNG